MFGPRELVDDDADGRPIWELFRFNPRTCEVTLINEVQSFTCLGPRGTNCVCQGCVGSPCGGDVCPDTGCDLETGECRDLCADQECEDAICNPRSGQCVQCLSNDDCDEGEACTDNECTLTPGAERDYSDWGEDGQDEPSCREDRDCTDDEECFPGGGPFDSLCYMECGNALACPDPLECCRWQGGPNLCAHPDSNRWEQLNCRR